MKKLQSSSLVLAGIVIGACVERITPTFTAEAAGGGGGNRCDYTYIMDTDAPNIGEAGQIEYDEDWQRVLSGGWTLKLNTGARYIFERCR